MWSARLWYRIVKSCSFLWWWSKGKGFRQYMSSTTHCYICGEVIQTGEQIIDHIDRRAEFATAHSQCCTQVRAAKLERLRANVKHPNCSPSEAQGWYELWSIQNDLIEGTVEWPSGCYVPWLITLHMFPEQDWDNPASWFLKPPTADQ